MYEQTLIQSGLDKEQALVYEALLKHGQMSAGAVHKVVPLKRGLVYKVLDELAALGLAEKKQEAGKVTQFMLAHPLTLKELAEKREQEAKDAKMALEGVLPSLVSDFNLVSGKPGVQFFEGLDGVQTVLNDSLTAKGEIYSYADIETIAKNIEDINRRYVARRERLGINKKGIILDTPFTREYLKEYHRLVTDVKFIKLDGAAPFQSIMQMYDGKISYITLAEDAKIGVIIEDQYLYTMHKYLFEYLWKITPNPVF
jgi:sugar-specific transcriptional regulator TrmB